MEFEKVETPRKPEQQSGIYPNDNICLSYGHGFMKIRMCSECRKRIK